MNADLLRGRAGVAPVLLLLMPALAAAVAATPAGAQTAAPADEHANTPAALPTDAATDGAAQAVARAATRYLQAWLAERSVEHAVTLERYTPPPEAPGAASWQWQARPLPPDARPAPRMTLWIDGIDGGRVRHSVLVVARVQARQAAWVASTDLAAGQPLDAAHWTRRHVEVTALAGVPWAGSIGEDGRAPARLQRRVLVGHVLLPTDVAPPRAIVRGQPVLARSRIGRIEVQAPALALQDGDIGQRVQVRIARAEDTVPATVVAGGEVEVAR